MDVCVSDFCNVAVMFYPLHCIIREKNKHDTIHQPALKKEMSVFSCGLLYYFAE